jgi:NAD kinase
VITPICSHLSLSRPLVVSASSRLTLELDSDYSTDLAVDGREEFSLQKGDLVQIERSSLVTNLVRLQQVSSLERINHLRGSSKLDVRPYRC